MANVIKKNNAINEAHFALALNEYRVVLMGIYQARIKNLNPLTDRIRFHVSDFVKSYGLKENTSKYHLALIESTLSLTSKMLIIRRPDEILKNKIKVTFANWVSEVSYIEKTGFVEIMFSQRVAEALMEEDARYTLYDLMLLSKLPSFYAIRILEYAMQWRTIGKTQFFEIEDLKQRLGIGLSFPLSDGSMSVPEDKYTETKLFNRDVIGRAVAMLNKTIPDLNMAYETTKVGKRVHGGHFTFNKASEAIVRSKEAKKLLEDEALRNKMLEMGDDGATENESDRPLDDDGLPQLGF